MIAIENINTSNQALKILHRHAKLQTFVKLTSSSDRDKDYRFETDNNIFTDPSDAAQYHQYCHGAKFENMQKERKRKHCCRAAASFREIRRC